MTKTILAAAAVLSFALAATASAKTYAFSFSNSADAGAGTFDVSGSTVEAVSGVVDGLMIQGLIELCRLGSTTQRDCSVRRLSGHFIFHGGRQLQSFFQSWGLSAESFRRPNRLPSKRSARRPEHLRRP